MTEKKKIPAFIVEDHNEVVEHLHSLFGRKRLPLFGLTMIHFDSHPDLLLSSSMPADKAFDRYGLQEALSIENWLLPLAYAGHITTIAWIRPEWSNQIGDGIYTFQIGKHVETGTIRITCKEPYFVSELLYAPPEDLESLKEVVLVVFSLKDFQDPLIGQTIDLMKKSCGYILDIDLDYFSTRNPFLALYPEARLYNRLEQIYYYKSRHDGTREGLNLTLERRKQQISELNCFFTALSLAKVTEFVEESTVSLHANCIQDAHRKAAVLDLVKAVVESYPAVEIDWCLVHDAGCTADETGLPHHVSSREEIMEVMIPQTEVFLKMLGRNPDAITISRSSEDDYCPKEDVEFIQENVLQVLQRLFVHLDVNKAYEEENQSQ